MKRRFAFVLGLALLGGPSVAEAAPPADDRDPTELVPSEPANEAEASPSNLDARQLAHHRRRTTLGIAGMSVLTTWSVANIAGGTIGNFATTGRARFFHQGNALWNTVNLVIGVIGLVGQSRERKRPVDLATSRTRSEKAQLAFAINAGLDVLYIGAGGAMWQLGQDTLEGPTQARVVGYGQALVLQGAFLFAFDVAMLAAHEHLSDRMKAANGTLSVALVPRIEGGAMIGARFRL